MIRKAGLRTRFEADSPVKSQDAIRVPCLAWSHNLFLHDVLVRQKAQLGKAAERQLFVLKIAEPVSDCEMKGVSFCGQGNQTLTSGK